MKISSGIAAGLLLGVLHFGFGQEIVPPLVPPPPVPALRPPLPPEVGKVAGTVNGPTWIGHRFVFDRYIGWGWIRPEGEKNWKKGRWVIFEEAPGLIAAPHRSLPYPEADNNVEYRLWGEIAPYRGYETNYDLFVDVFVIKGYQVLGQAAPLKLKPPVKVASRGKKTQSSPMSRSR